MFLKQFGVVEYIKNKLSAKEKKKRQFCALNLNSNIKKYTQNCYFLSTFINSHLKFK